uniref:Myb-like domain-containing protein n=1 Tax=Glossina austeni TaxID=7395 RepID=A0A1A9UXL6_GLOAU
MAMRRPRIKAVANIQLNTKRKSKPSLDPVPAKSGRIQEIQESKISEKPTTTTTTTSKEDDGTKTSNCNECVEAPVENVVTDENSKETPNSEEHIEVTVENSRLNIQKRASSSKTVTNTKWDDGSDEALKTKVENGPAVEDSTKAKANLGQNSNFEQLNVFTNTPNAEEELSVSRTEAQGVGNFYEIVSKEGGANNTSLCLQSPKKNEVRQSLVLDKNTFHADSTKTLFPTNSNESDFTKGSMLTDDKDAFKCPAKVEYSRSVSHSSAGGADDVFYSDLEENVLQMDLQRSANGFPMSPSKIQSRQRIRPTPIFGQRRNSFVGSSPSSHNSIQEEPLTCTDFQRKERYHSASVNNTANSSTNQQNLHNTSYNKSASGRVRTESSCSNFSEINFPTHKLRRNDDRDVHRQHLRREFEARFVNGVPDKSALKMFDLIYYNPITNPMEQKANENVKVEANSNNDIKPFEAKQEKATVDDKLDTNASMPVPQLKLNANGELILDDESLVVETTAERKARKVWENSELIYLDENTGMNGFYKRQKRTREWEWSETIKFYRCLQTVGTDFSLMVSLFPNRTRRDLKLKFKKEERINGALINKALLHPKQFNIEELRQQVEAEEEERKKLQNMSKAYIEKKIKEPKKKKCAQQSAANRLLSGYDVYENENQKIKRRKNGKIKLIDGDKEKVIEASGKEQDDTSTVLSEECKRKSAKIGAEKRRRRRPTPINNDISNVKTQQIIKNEESSKYEGKQESLNLGCSAQEEDVKQLETELNNLLQTESYELTSATDAPSLESAGPVKASLISSLEDFQTTGPTTSVSDCHEFTLTNMDDGTITHVVDLKHDGDERISLSDEIQEPDNDLVQQNIQKILTELAEGTLILVSTLDPDNPDKVLNEIYMMDKDTGDLCDEPLNIPDDIVQCIMSVMS